MPNLIVNINDFYIYIYIYMILLDKFVQNIKYINNTLLLYHNIIRINFFLQKHKNIYY